MDRRNITTIALQVITIVVTLGALLWPFTTRLESRLTALEVKVERLQADLRDLAASALKWTRPAADPHWER
jgi:hypothetical protein